MAGSVSAARAALTGTGATPQSEGLVRVRTQVCLHTCPRLPWGRSRAINPSRKGCWTDQTAPAPPHRYQEGDVADVMIPSRFRSRLLSILLLPLVRWLRGLDVGP